MGERLVRAAAVTLLVLGAGCLRREAPPPDSDQGSPAVLASSDDDPAVQLRVVRAAIRDVLSDGGITFLSGSPQFTADSKERLRRVAEILQRNPGVDVRIEGHTDSRGDDGANLELSQRRADRVRAFLFAQGVDLERLSSHGYGESRPLEGNGSAAGRAANRRVDLIPVATDRR